MNDRDRTILTRRLRRALRRIYLTSLGAAHIYRGHSRRSQAPELRAQLRAYAAQMVARRVEAAELLGGLGARRPGQRLLWHPVAWLWGRMTAWTGPVFRLHMAANLEHNCGEMAKAAIALTRVLALAEVTEGLEAMARTDRARREWLVERLRQAAEAAANPSDGAP